ncbi:hypothetical protein K8I85_08260 [bacterium]|nr:hypothetical protein [bacterium]
MREVVARLVILSGLAAIAIAPAPRAAAQDLGTLGSTEPLRVSGTLSASYSAYDAKDRPPSRESSSWLLQGSPTVTLYGVVLPFRFTVTEQDREFRQPLNRIGVSPRYRWATAHLGYRNLSWSPYSLAGHSVLGGGIELSPRGYRAGLIRGRLRRAIEADSTAEAGSIQPVFRRDVTAFRLGWGTGIVDVDLVGLTAHDDAGTVDAAGIPSTLRPAENGVVSVSAGVRLHERVSAHVEVAQSAYTGDWDTPSEGDLGMTLLGLFGSMKKHESTVEAQAVEASITWTEPLGGLGVRWRRIDPGYRSMGAYYFHDDVENFTLEPELNLASGMVRLSGSLGLQHDNVDEDKEVQTDRTIGSAQLEFAPGTRYRANATFSNYDIDQKAGTSPLDSTGAVVSQATREVGLTQTVTLPGARYSHNVMLMLNRAHLDDRSSLTGLLDNSYTSTMAAGSYVLSVTPLGLSGSIGYSRGRFDLTAGETVAQGPQCGLSKSFLRGKANAGVTASLRSTSLDGDEQIRTTTLLANASVRPARRHRIHLRVSLQDNEAKSAAASSSRETRSEVGYAYTF